MRGTSLARAGAIAAMSACVVLAGCGSSSSTGTSRNAGSAAKATSTAAASKSGGKDGGKVSFTGSENGSLTFDSVDCSIDSHDKMMAANGNINGNDALAVLPGDSDPALTITTDAATTNTKTFSNLGGSGKGITIVHTGDSWKVTFEKVAAPKATGAGSVTVDGEMICTKVAKLPG